MAGYQNFSLSNNAIEAYKEGQLPKSKAANQIRLAAKLILQKCDLLTEERKFDLRGTPKIAFYRYTSYHHTSSKYNATNFYSVQDKTYDVLSSLFNGDLPDSVLDELANFGNAFIGYTFIDTAKELNEKTKKAIG
jgi:hypothetical protein